MSADDPRSLASSSEVNLHARLAAELEELRREHTYRKLTISAGHDFSSNDYLSLASDRALRDGLADRVLTLPSSASGSRLLRGNHELYQEVEAKFARFVGSPRALLFNSGYDANFALLSTLPTRHDTIYFDAAVHASIKEGMRASFAHKRSFRHNDSEQLAEQLRSAPRSGDTYIVVESIYSMDGDEAPIDALVKLAQEYGAMLIVDEAHATGVFGPNGSGLINEHRHRNAVLATIHTCGKALASHGGFVCGSELLIDYLINRARPFIFSTALPPAIPAQLLGVLDRLASPDGIGRRSRVLDNATFLRSALRSTLTRWTVPDDRSPIIPVVIGDAHETLKASQFLVARGFDVRAIRPPTVPVGSSRLRIVVHSDADHELLTALACAVFDAEVHLTA